MYKILLFLIAFMGLNLSAMAQVSDNDEQNETQTIETQTALNLPITKLKYNSFAMGEQIMNRHQYKEHLKLNCPIAYKQFNTGRKLVISGYSLLGVGAVSAIAGPIMLFGGIFTNSKGAAYSGATLCFLSIGAAAASVPCLVVGYIKRGNAIKTYNGKCASPSLSYQVSPASFGLTLTF